jgi:hypothetical protein
MIQPQKRRPEFFDLRKRVLLKALRHCPNAVIASGAHC